MLRAHRASRVAGVDPAAVRVGGRPVTAHEYRSGRWTALVNDGALALLDPSLPDAVARELWQLAAGGTRLGAWVEYLAAAGIAALPSFAMVEAHRSEEHTSELQSRGHL